MRSEPVLRCAPAPGKVRPAAMEAQPTTDGNKSWSVVPDRSRFWSVNLTPAAYCCREAPVRHWILMFRPETHAEAVRHGLIGVQYMHRHRFAEMRPGDRFITYLSRARVIDGHGELTSDPFEQVADVPKGWKHYVERCRVRFDQTGAGVDGAELLWGLSAFSKGLNTWPGNYIFCKGGFLEITEEDYAWLTKVLDGTWAPTVPPTPRS